MSDEPCANCGSTNIETDYSLTRKICVECGLVQDDVDGYVNDNIRLGRGEFGKFRTHTFNNLTDGEVAGDVQSLRQASVYFQRARREIDFICKALALNSRCVDVACRFYKLAVSRKLPKEVRTRFIPPSCVYLTCRIEETPHILIDVCDHCQVNLFDLGKAYMVLKRVLSVCTPSIDPSLYMMRFASQLHFGNQAQEVIITASRVVQRMKKDWMHFGRRPTGLCGAAILVAAKLHGMDRTAEEIMKIARVCRKTIRRRIVDFVKTPSSQLTYEEFMSTDIEREEDPPSFTKARSFEMKLDDADSLNNIKQEVYQLQNKIDAYLEKMNKRSKYYKLFAAPEDSSSDVLGSESCPPNDIDALIAESTVVSLKQDMPEDLDNEFRIDQITSVLMKGPEPFPQSTDSSDPKSSSEGSEIKPEIKEESEKRSKDCFPDPGPSHNDVDDKCLLESYDLNDKEMDYYLLNEEEIAKKDRFWHVNNDDYLKLEQERKERKALKEQEDLIRPIKRRNRTRHVEAKTAGEAVAAMLKRKNISFKLNYDVLKNLDTADQQSNTLARDEEDIATIIEKRFRLKVRPKAPAPVPQHIKLKMAELIKRNSSFLQKKILEEKAKKQQPVLGQPVITIKDEKEEEISREPKASTEENCSSTGGESLTVKTENPCVDSDENL